MLEAIRKLNLILQALLVNPIVAEYNKEGWRIEKYADGKMIARARLMDTPTIGYIAKSLPSEMVVAENLFANMRYNGKDGTGRCIPDISAGKAVLYLRNATNGLAEANTNGTDVEVIGRWK